jgi:hypothetical protein
MFYKHWKKIALALTGFFWAGCEDSGSSAVCLYGPDPNYSNPAENPVSSSSDATDNKIGSSSSEATKPESSTSFGHEVVPLYGVEMDKTICTQVEGESTIRCNDGITCTQKTEERWAPEFPCSDEICPDYGVVQISENTYECDGKVYNEAEFRTRYEKVTVVEKPEQDSTFNGEMQPALYGPPCVFNDTCDDAEK